MIKAIIFDFDGLIVDNEPLQTLAFKGVIELYGKTPIPETNGLFHTVGLGGGKNYKMLMKKYGIKEKIETLRQKRNNIYLQLLNEKNIQIMPGLSKLIKTLTKNNIKMGIASGSLLDHIELILKKLKIIEHFETIVSTREVSRAKPFPDVYLEAARRIKVDPKSCLVFEDSETGLRAGKRAGMKVIAVPSKYTKYQNFSKADKIVKSLSDITIPVLNSL